MKLSWEGEFEVPAEMLDFEEKKQALNTPTGRFMVWSHREVIRQGIPKTPLKP